MNHHYIYNPQSNTIICDKGERQPYGFDLKGSLAITPEVFLGENSEEIITSLKTQYPQFADEFRSAVANIWPDYITHRDSDDPKMKETYRKVIAIQLAAFINTKWVIGELN